MKKLLRVPLFLCLCFSLITFYGCNEDGDTDCQLFGDCDGGGGGDDCSVDLYFTNNDGYDYIIYSVESGNSYYIPAWGTESFSSSYDYCVEYEIWYGSVGTGDYEGSSTICPCSYSYGQDVSVNIDFY